MAFGPALTTSYVFTPTAYESLAHCGNALPQGCWAVVIGATPLFGSPSGKKKISSSLHTYVPQTV